jgi:hypothetical protein
MALGVPWTFTPSGLLFNKPWRMFSIRCQEGFIFLKLHIIGWDIIQLIYFVCAFYAFEFCLFYNHCNRESNDIITPFAMGTYQNNLLKNTLFTLA